MIEEWLKEAHEQDKARGLGAHREEGGGRRGSALVDIGNPDLHGHRANFEGEADQHQGDAKEERSVRTGYASLGLIPEEAGYLGEIEGARRAVDPGDSVNQETGTQGTEDEVLHAGFK